MNKKINYADKDVLSDEDFNKNNIKEKATIWIDENVLNAFKERVLRCQKLLCFRSYQKKLLKQVVNYP